MLGRGRRLFGALILMLIPVLGYGKMVETLGDLQATLSAHSVIRGSFKQIRTLDMFNQPLVSEGQFLLSEEHGLQWMQTKPFSVLLVLGEDQLSQQFGDQPAQVMKADENPMMFHFSRLFLSIFRGETEGLTEQFKVQFSPLKNAAMNWSLKLTPKQEPLSTAFKVILMQGGEYIYTIRLEEMNGDISEISFSNQSNKPNTLTDKERSAFEF